MQQQQTISWSDCDVWWKVDLYNNQRWPAQWLDWEEAPNHFPKPNLHPRRVMVTVWWSAAHVIHYSFLNPGETIMSERSAQQIDELHWKLQHLQPALVNRKGPSSSQHLMTECCTTNASLNKLGYEVLPHSPYLPDLSPTDYHFFKHLNNFLKGKDLHNQQEAKNTFQEFIKSQSIDFFMLQE